MSETTRSGIRVRALRTIVSTDGETSIVVVRGTAGLADEVIVSRRGAKGPNVTTLRVWWDAVLLTASDKVSCVSEGWEDLLVDPDLVEVTEP